MNKTKIFVGCMLLSSANAFAQQNSTGLGATTVGGSGLIGRIQSNNSVSIGQGAGASDNGIAIGVGTSAGNSAVSIGIGSVTDDNAVSIGSNNMVESSNVGLGNNLNVSGVANSVALGNNTSVARSNEVAVGGRTIGGLGVATSDDQAANFGQAKAMVNDGVTQAVSNAASYTNSVAASTLGSANAYTDGKTATIKQEAVTEANAYTDNVGASVLNNANTYTDNTVKGYAKKDYVDAAVAGGVKQANAYTDDKFKQASKIAYSAASVGMASSALVFNPNIQRQVAVGAATVHGTSALAVGIAWRHGERGMFNVRGALGQNGTSGVAIGYSMGF